MKNIDILRGFINCTNKIGAKVGNLRIEGNKLYNYYTVIAVREDNGTIYLNNTKYSMTTTKNQNIIRRESCKIVEMSQDELYKKFNI